MENQSIDVDEREEVDQISSASCIPRITNHRKWKSRMEEPESDADSWWFICKVCNQAFDENERHLLKTHNMQVHGSLSTVNVLTLSQTADLDIRVMVARCRAVKNGPSDRENVHDSLRLDIIKTEADIEEDLISNAPSPIPTICSSIDQEEEGRGNTTKRMKLVPPRASRLKRKGPKKRSGTETQIRSINASFAIHYYKEHNISSTKTSYSCDVCCRPFLECRKVISHLKLAHAKHMIALSQRKENEGACTCLVCYKEALLRPLDATTGIWICKLCGQNVEEQGIKTHARMNHSDYKLPPKSELDPPAQSEWRSAKLLLYKNLDSLPDRTKAEIVENHSQHLTRYHYYQCNLCDKRYRNKCSLDDHLRKSTHGQPRKQVQEAFGELTCPICSKLLIGRSIRWHLKFAHKTEKDHLCSTCGAVFKNAENLRAHSVRHDETKKKHICELCGKKFFRAFSLRVHLAYHGAREIKCPVCGKMYKSTKGLKFHQLLKHSAPDVLPFKCNQCGAGFKYRMGLRCHLAVHVEGTPFRCTKCRKAFKTDLRLTSHVYIVHSDKEKRMYSCKLCDQKFRGITNLQQHELQVHNFQRELKKRQYQCKLCDAKFGTKLSLEQHEVQHIQDSNHIRETKERNVKCDHPGCEKAFFTASTLRQHKLSHLAYEDFPHVCDVCGRRFNFKHVLQTHQQRIHGRSAIISMTPATTSHHDDLPT